jgi:hypothetical protein
MRPRKVLAIALLTALAPAGSALAADAALYQFEQQAKQHCPGDTIVWLSPASGTYTFPGERWYGSTKRGAFICRREGDLAGYRPSHEPAPDRSPVTQAAIPVAVELPR